MKILIINGPNLNLLGKREPHIYGTETMQDILDNLRCEFKEIDIECFQSNHEGALIDCLHEAGYGKNKIDGIIINAGGYTHTSIALADAISAIPVDVIEVHISNIAARESYRHKSLLSTVCKGSICGLGSKVYKLALLALIE